ncbi:unnamed protein product [Closterium sp. NIES-54]
MAGSADPPTDVSLGGTSLASDASQWKLVAPGVWDLTRSLDWVTFGIALTGGRAADALCSAAADSVHCTPPVAIPLMHASSCFQFHSAPPMRPPSHPSHVPGLPVLPSMARGRFQAMFSGAVAGGAKIRIATSTETSHSTHLVLSPHLLYLLYPLLPPLSPPPACSGTKVTLEVHLVFTKGVDSLTPAHLVLSPHLLYLLYPLLPPLSAPPACSDTKVTLEVHLVFTKGVDSFTPAHLVLSPHLLYLLYPLLPPLSAPPACSDTKVTLEIHLAFTKGVNTNSKVSLVGQVGADKSAPLALACPFTSTIKGVFTCSKTIDVKIPTETATTPKVLGLQKFMAALVGATMSCDNLATTFMLTVSGQQEPLYYAL